MGDPGSIPDTARILYSRTLNQLSYYDKLMMILILVKQVVAL